jgi:hypothetical protein
MSAATRFSGMVVASEIDSQLNWEYGRNDKRYGTLYRQARQTQWDVDDLDWSSGSPFAEPGSNPYSGPPAAFAESPLGRGGVELWRRFRTEFQTWMISQFLHGEPGALVGAARMVEVLPTVEAKSVAASQVADEARHIEAFERYLSMYAPQIYPLSDPVAHLLHASLSSRCLDITVIGIQLIVEGIAMGSFQLANATFDDPLIRNITRLVARDEARHVALGIRSVEGFHDRTSEVEQRDCEEFILEAARRVSERFELADVWERLGVPAADGRTFASTSPLLTRYRQAAFGRAIGALRRGGLLTGPVRDGLLAMGLLRTSLIATEPAKTQRGLDRDSPI